MANVLKDLSDGDINREMLAEFHNALTFLKTINNQYDDRFGKPGHKNDGRILIRNPNEYTVRTGKTIDVQDANETTQEMVVATQKGVDLPSFSSLEQTMQVDDFRARFLRPAMLRLAAEIESDILNNVYQDVFNLTGTPATTPATLSPIRTANSRITENLAPRGDRSLLVDPTTMATLANSIATYFHQNREIEKSFIDGFVGHAVGLDWFESTMVPTHTNGSRTDTTPVCNTSTGITSGTATITTTAGSALTMNVGDIFTVADVYAINRETKARLSHLQQFTVTVAVASADGTEVIAVAPTPVTSGARQNVELVSAGADKAVTNLTGGGSGAASTPYTQNLAYHRDAFTFATTDLHIEPGQRMTREVIDGISMRVWHGCDIKNDDFFTRVDILYGYLTQRPEWATRVRG